MLAAPSSPATYSAGFCYALFQLRITIGGLTCSRPLFATPWSYSRYRAMPPLRGLMPLRLYIRDFDASFSESEPSQNRLQDILHNGDNTGIYANLRCDISLCYWRTACIHDRPDHYPYKNGRCEFRWFKILCPG